MSGTISLDGKLNRIDHQLDADVIAHGRSRWNRYAHEHLRLARPGRNVRKRLRRPGRGAIQPRLGRRHPDHRRIYHGIRILDRDQQILILLGRIGIPDE